jgi:hypothetical protein
VNLTGSQITKDASLKSGAVKVQLTARIGEMSTAVSLISPDLCKNIMHFFITFAAG